MSILAWLYYRDKEFIIWGYDACGLTTMIWKAWSKFFGHRLPSLQLSKVGLIVCIGVCVERFVLHVCEAVRCAVVKPSL